MRLFLKVSLFLLPALATVSLSAQNVSSTGGVANAVPVYSDATTITASPIKVSGSNVGVGETSPSAAFNISNGGSLRLFNNYGYPESGSITSILFAGGDNPSGYSWILGSGSDCCYGAGNLMFGTLLNGSITEKMRLNAWGNLGLGTPWPNSELSIVAGNPNNETGAHILNTETNGYTVIRLGVDSIAAAGSAWHQFNSGWPDDPASATAPLSTSIMAFESGGMNFSTINPASSLRFFTAGGASSNERLRIDASGNVGIGRTAPASKLDVNGIIRATGFANADGSPLVSASSGNFTGGVNITTTSAQSSLHAISPASPLTPNPYLGPYGAGNVIVEASGGRSTSSGAAITFATAANNDGSNVWEQGRIITVAGTSSNVDASGEMYLQTRYHRTDADVWDWRNNLVLAYDGSVGIGTTTPGAALRAAVPAQQGPVLEVMGSIHLHGNLYFDDPGTPQSQPYTGSTCTSAQLGPSAAPSGSCSTNGTWVFSQDGHATFCSNGIWTTKI